MENQETNSKQGDGDEEKRQSYVPPIPTGWRRWALVVSTSTRPLLTRKSNLPMGRIQDREAPDIDIIYILDVLLIY